MNDRKVRYVSFYETPKEGEGMLAVRYTPNEPRNIIQMHNFDTGDDWEETLVGYGSTGGWVTIEAAKGMVTEIYEQEVEDSEDESGDSQ